MNRIARLTVGGAPLGDEPPTEFRIFRRGENASDQGVFLFDDLAAESVMQAWKRWGVDLAIDLNHQMLDADSGSREDAADARGWFGLEVRNGELWAVNVKWTEDGARRVRDKLQRYISPAFQHDESNRVTEVLNVAIVAMPATFGPQQLIAASRNHMASGSAVARARAYLAKQKRKHGR